MNKWILLSAMCFISFGAYAGSIKAIVNDVPISEWDVTTHARLLKTQQPEVYEGMPSKKLKKIALNAVIEEILKAQKGKSLNLSLTDAEVDQAIQNLEQQNGLSVGGLKRLLDEGNVPMQTLRKQVYGDLMWLQYVKTQSGVVGSQVPASAVQKRIQKIKSEMAKPSFTVAEIVVPTLEEAQSIWDELQNGTSSFPDLARQFSKAKSAKAGGHVGTVDENYYGKENIPILREMPVGQLSRPLAVKNGYALIVMIDKKLPITKDSIMVWELAQGGQQAGAESEKILAAKNCNTFVKALKAEGIPESVQRGWTDPNQLPAELKELMDGAALNEVVGPIRVPQGQLFFMKCNLKTQRVMPTFDEVKQQLEMEQMQLLSRRLLEAEKRAAVIEYKE